MSVLSLEALLISPPGSGGTLTAPNGASSAAVNLTPYAGRWLMFTSDVKAYVRFGAADVGAATVGDIYFTADAHYPFRVPRDGTRSYVRARGHATGTLHYRVTSGPV